MKKVCYYFSFLFFLILLMCMSVPVSANSPIQVQVDGDEIKYTASPAIINNKLMVPVRKTAEIMGLKVEWSGQDQMVSIIGNGKTIEIMVDSKKATINRKQIQLEVAPTIVNGETLIPLRFLSDEFGYILEWNPNKNTVALFSSMEEDQNNDQEVNADIPVLMYHSLIDNLNTSLSVDPERFREQMAALKTRGYNTITDYDLLNFLEKGTPLPDNPILITFDDGYKSNYSEAYPVLKELGLKATIYVITSRIFEDVTILPGESEKITWKDAREMMGTMLIQSHTWDSHKMVMSATGAERGLIASPIIINGHVESQQEYETRIYEDLVQSKKAIEEKLGYEVVSIAYPYGDYSQETINMALNAGYKMGFAVRDGVVNKEDHLFKLDRIQVYGSYSGEELINVIEGAN
ncbi:stalk domain-containing protein [Niallia oryzisoli]|uniref:stalk domain-containing protein n=1 Tax=Niallia oryzisoli TaxID=1737571 RepID=UPI003736776D